ncbi:MAG TPA: efflux RND transporter permease subunit [Stellaceae bacterium]|nr:efflux RND transporter permease subunit [Stellaceae bacterium]
MSLSEPFIRRPVATTLLTLGVLLLGALAYAKLPIAALPSVDRPTIGVSAVLPGASPDTVAVSLAQPLERQLGTIPGIAEMVAFSGQGGATITIQFDLGKDIDEAAAEVQAAINAAGPNLPHDLPQPPQYYKANPSGFAVIVLALTSDVVDPAEIYSLADSVVVQKLSQIDGVAKVNITGGERGAVRIRVDPRQIATMKLSLEEIRSAVVLATQNTPKGAISIDQQSFTIGSNDQLFKAVDYREIVVAWRNKAPVRLGDIATVEDNVINDKLAGWYNTGRAVMVYVTKQPDANVVEVVDQVIATLPQMAHWMPPSVKVHVVYNRTTLIRASIADVQLTIAIATGLVILVMALFLKRFWATAIPALTIPVSLAATFGAMALLGYTLDNLSLMAVTIAVGFVVDDAVIMIENIIRLIEEGHTAFDAALIGARQMAFTIVSVTAALVAALIPVLFMPDVVGRYFSEFGMTLVAAIIASALVSVTLTPMLCGQLLTNPTAASPAGTRARPSWFERGFSATVRCYLASLDWALRHRWISLGLTLVVTAATIGIYLALPKGFMPTQDTGILFVRTITNANISFAAMEDRQQAVANAILADPAVDDLVSYIGGQGSILSNGTMLVNLKPVTERKLSIQQVIARLRTTLGKVDGIRALFTPVQDLQIGVGGSASRYQYTVSGINTDQVLQWGEVMRRRIVALAEVTDVITNVEAIGLQAGLEINRMRAASLGITPMGIDNTLYDAFGQRQIKTIYLPLNYTRVVLELDPRFQTDPSVFEQIYVPGVNNAAVPLATLMRPTRAHAPMWEFHQDQFPSMTISFDTKPGVSLGQAITAIRKAEATANRPDELKVEFKGEAGEANKSGAKQMLLFAAAIVAIYVVLGVLYESYAHPLTILSTLPSAAFGALAALLLTKTEFTIITSIGCILLVGMVMKNAIMMVDFALALERIEGLSPDRSIREAARLRVRPITMTMLAAILSAVPLAIGTGPGFELRQPLGIAIVGGLLVSQFLTLYTTPLAYLLIDRLRPRARLVGAAAE